VALFYEVREEEQPHPVFLVKGRTPLPSFSPYLSFPFSLSLSLSLSLCLLFSLSSSRIACKERWRNLGIRPPLRVSSTENLTTPRENCCRKHRHTECQRKFFFSAIVQKKGFSRKLANFGQSILLLLSCVINSDSTNKFDLG